MTRPWYVTTRQFLEDIGDFMEQNLEHTDGLNHPDDIAFTIGLVAQALASGMVLGAIRATEEA